MNLRIALAGNPNSGKSTLFNALTGSNQFVGNWPGVTVEKKEGRVKQHGDMVVIDLPGIYSLSPYSLEEVIARDYLVHERPDVILNIVDGTNLERNLYLTTQLVELGIPMVIAINRMDVVKKCGDRIRTKELSGALGCAVVKISALQGTGIVEVVDAAREAATSGGTALVPPFSQAVEHALLRIKEIVPSLPGKQARWVAVKLLERDHRVQEQLALSEEQLNRLEQEIRALETVLDDDAASIISNERYEYIHTLLSACYQKKSGEKRSVSDRIDRVVTNRWLGLPIFAVVMFLVYWIAMVGVGAPATDFTNDCIFGDGFHLFDDGGYAAAAEEYAAATAIVDGYDAFLEEQGTAPGGEFHYIVEDEETLEFTEETASLAEVEAAKRTLEALGGEPDPAEYGIWIPGIPALAEQALDALHVADWLKALLLDGVIAGVGAVLGFVPQMLVLFLMLAFLEACGYMARIAFVLDRVFRRFGLSGKSFIPMLVGMGCGVPGIMASRTIEDVRDRRMTIITTTFIPCGAKVPFIAMMAGALFGKSAWVSTSAYFIGMAAILLSGILLKKTALFAGDPAPFVMELPGYHLPTVENLLRATWERGWSFIQKAGTIILLSTIVLWFATYFGFTAEGFGMLTEDELDCSLLAKAGGAVAWLFAPLGWGNWQAAVASVTGLVAKENIVGTMGILYGGGDGTVWQALNQAFTPVSGYSFLVFNLLCAPCFAAIGAIKREMNSTAWTCFAVGYQCVFAYAAALMIQQFGSWAMGEPNLLGLAAATAVLLVMLYLLLKPAQTAKQFNPAKILQK